LLQVLFRLLVGASLLLTAATVYAETDRQTRTFALPAGRSLTLEITIGTVRIEGSARTDAVVEIVRHAPSAEDFTRIPIELQEEEANVRIRALQAEGGTDAALRTDVTLRVPHAAVLRSVRILEGRLMMSALHGEINADIRRGPIEAVGLQGIVRLESGIGDVVADRARLSQDGLLRLRAFNGDVRLTLAEQPLDARIMALALNGTISSDIPLRTKDTWGPRWGEATLGKGEPVISIDVITGRIEIKAPQ
jgi:DUF4097 and DUF4098 domain-containing protein YvlB